MGLAFDNLQRAVLEAGPGRLEAVRAGGGSNAGADGEEVPTPSLLYPAPGPCCSSLSPGTPSAWARPFRCLLPGSDARAARQEAPRRSLWEQAGDAGGRGTPGLGQPRVKA